MNMVTIRRMKIKRKAKGRCYYSGRMLNFGYKSLSCVAPVLFRDMKDYMKLSRRENPDQIILHVENINLDSDSTGDIATASR